MMSGRGLRGVGGVWVDKGRGSGSVKMLILGKQRGTG